MTAEELATRLASTYEATPRRVGQEYRVFCPVHEADGGDHKPSLAIWDRGNNRVAWKCMTGCDKSAVRAGIVARGVSLPSAGPQTTEQMMANAAANERRRLESLTKAWEAYNTSFDVKAGDVVDTYLRSRAIDITKIPSMGTIRCSPDTNTMVGLIVDLTTLTDATPKAKGVMTLALNADGTPWKDPEGRKLRSIAGTQKGFGVPFGVPGPHLVVAEGVESMLAAMILLNIPFGVATLSAANMPPLAIPEWVRRVTIAQDQDAPGIAAGYALRDTLNLCGVPARARNWGAGEGVPEGWDANDQLMKNQREERL